MKHDRTTSRLAKESSGQRRTLLLLAAIALMTLPSTRLVNAHGMLYSVNTASDNLVANAATFPSLPMAMPAFLTVIDDWEKALVA